MIRLISFLCLGVLVGPAIAQDKEAAFALEVANRIAGKPSVRGDEDQWLFLVRELRHLSTGRFWEKSWEELAVNQTNPVPSIVEFQEMLSERGKRLILVPVPAKGRIYPEKLSAAFSLEEVDSLSGFVAELREAGLAVIDLDAAFREQREANDDAQLYCAQDAHFSPFGIELIADLIVMELGSKAVSSSEITRRNEEALSITGDQVVGSEWEGSIPSEALPVRLIEFGGEPGVNPDPESPYLLLGDSHTLVFHQGKEAGMHCRGGGLLDQLSFRLGRPLDLVGVRGSGLVQARKQLFYRASEDPGFWDKKELVIWMFSEREFTQSSDRIVSIPLDR